MLGGIKREEAAVDRSKGFTLIELLLVLAIIGIISAIALPALLGQRTRTRDKAAMSNLLGHLGDLVGQFEKARDEGLDGPATTQRLDRYLVDTVGAVQSPWGNGVAFNTTPRVVTGATSRDAFEAAMQPNAPSILGKVRVYVQYPVPGGAPGYVGMVTNLSQSINGSGSVFRKSAALD
jgi:prepilin-type N-terminal cleavage/methylation domain-containing protein